MGDLRFDYKDRLDRARVGGAASPAELHALLSDPAPIVRYAAACNPATLPEDVAAAKAADWVIESLIRACGTSMLYPASEVTAIPSRPQPVRNRASSSWTGKPTISDADPEAWHAMRRRGITATDIRDYGPRKGRANWESSIKRLISHKNESPRPTKPAMDWGTEREPEIAEFARELYGLTPESRVFTSSANPLYMASPDGIDARTLRVGEYKTGGTPITDGAVPAEKIAEYQDQIQWQMFVLGAQEAVLVYEERFGNEGEFKPGARAAVTIPRDDVRIATLREFADKFLEAYSDSK